MLLCYFLANKCSFHGRYKTRLWTLWSATLWMKPCPVVELRLGYPSSLCWVYVTEETLTVICLIGMKSALCLTRSKILASWGFINASSETYTNIKTCQNKAKTKHFQQTWLISVTRLIKYNLYWNSLINA